MRQLDKLVIQKTDGNIVTPMPSPFGYQYVRVTSIYYSSDNPQYQLNLLDQDGDVIYFITGDPKKRPVILDGVLLAKLPLSITDTDVDGGNTVILYVEYIPKGESPEDS